MPTIYINGQMVPLKASMVIGKGGEADIYKLDKTSVLKLFRQPNDPEYQNDQNAKLGAKLRLDEQQHKLSVFPTTLPREVVAPTALAYNKTGDKVLGYVMPFIDNMEVLMRLGDRTYRETGGINANRVIETFKRLHKTVEAIHSRQVVIGDFNDLNVLFDDKQLRVVDADSMQFGGFYCHTFTSRFIDPLLSGPNSLSLVRPHNEDSDWYAYFIMLIQSLLYVGPYGGVHRPASGPRLQHDARVQARLTVLGSDIIYPKPALPLSVLPDEWLSYLSQVFEKDVREVFPHKLLDTLRWTTCSNCGTAHAKRVCPNCALPGAVKQSVTIRGTVTARRVFQTHGRLLQVAFQAGKLRYLYHENGAFYREDGRTLLTGDLDPELRIRLQGANTLIGKRTSLIRINDAGQAQRVDTDAYRTVLPVFDANADYSYWVEGNQLVRSEAVGTGYVGDILPSQTLFWVGTSFGFGFYQANQLVRAFVFKTGERGINDQVAIDSLPGQLVDATCALSESHAWFMLAYQEQGELLHRCIVIQKDGTVVAETVVKQGDDSWLGKGIRGHLAVGASLYVATDDGIERVGLDGAEIVRERTFPDTEPFVDTHTQLILGPGGIHAVSAREITLLEIR